jgi:hypothetical protein
MAPPSPAESVKLLTPPEKWRKIWLASLAVHGAGSIFDGVSSRGLTEANPLLANSSGQFDGRSAAIKGAITGTALGLQFWAIHKHPELAKPLSWVNFAAGGIYTGVGAHNLSLQH